MSIHKGWLVPPLSLYSDIVTLCIMKVTTFHVKLRSSLRYRVLKPRLQHFLSFLPLCRPYLQVIPTSSVRTQTTVEPISLQNPPTAQLPPGESFLINRSYEMSDEDPDTDAQCSRDKFLAFALLLSCSGVGVFGWLLAQSQSPSGTRTAVIGLSLFSGFVALLSIFLVVSVSKRYRQIQHRRNHHLAWSAFV